MPSRVQSSVFAGRQPRAAKEQAQRYERERRNTTARRLYQTPQWRALRAQHLREHPMCEEPGCRLRGCVVDHRRPHRGDNALFFDRGNLCTLCKSHHDRKTAKFDGGFGNARRFPEPDDASGFGLV